ncbi:cation:proton antiporter [Actinosynnema sp. NPDC023794]
MNSLLLVIAIAMSVRSLAASRLDRWNLGAPVVIVVAGVVIGLVNEGSIKIALNTQAMLYMAEIVLAVLLFVDATGFAAGGCKAAHRGLRPGCCSSRCRSAGGCSPACPGRCTCCSPAWSFPSTSPPPNGSGAIAVCRRGFVLPFALKALVACLLPGAALALLLTYTAAVAVDGNGFVASFVCGITFRYVHRQAKARQIRNAPQGRDLLRRGALDEDFRLLEDFTTLLTMTLWFVVGITAVVAFSDGLPWQVALFSIAALTVVRMVPAHLSLTGSVLTQGERLQVGTLGPRGTTSIVFGLLAFNRLPEGPAADTILLVTVTVVLSVVLHGIGAGPTVKWLTPAKPARH